ncbi:MAG: hypothetical protein IT539_02330 [Bradyrhizobiaceae bacterium]|nr:hypothetical protein [Bradyrhizobiaceae bacterium]
MATLTYDLGAAAGTVKAAAPARKGFWARVLDAMIEARMREAERQIRQYMYLLPEDVLARSGYKATYKDANKLPFVK